jgi:hypothetical protein
MPIIFSYHTSGTSWKVLTEWMWYGTHITGAVLKSAREKRGKGIRRKVAGPNKIPRKWQEFLKDSDNTQEIFTFLSEKVVKAQFTDEKVVLITSGQSVLIRGTDHMMPENDHEEAGTRVLRHLQNTLQTGSCACLVRAVDTDVIVIITGKLCKLQAMCLATEVWIAFGTAKNFSTFKSMRLP